MHPLPPPSFEAPPPPLLMLTPPPLPPPSSHPPRACTPCTLAALAPLTWCPCPPACCPLLSLQAARASQGSLPPPTSFEEQLYPPGRLLLLQPQGQGGGGGRGERASLSEVGRYCTEILLVDSMFSDHRMSCYSQALARV